MSISEAHPTLRTLPSRYFQALLSIMKSKTGRNTRTLFVNQVLSGVTGFFTTLLLIRHLNVRDYGLLSLFTSVYMLFGGLIHLGWLDTYVRFGSKHYGQSAFESLRSLTFRRMISFSAGLCLLGLLASRWICAHVYERPEFTGYFRSAIALGLLTCIFTFMISDLRVAQDYRRIVRYNLDPQISRLICVAALIFLGRLTLQYVAEIYIFVPLVFTLFYFSTPGAAFKNLIASKEVEPSLLREVNAYNIWSFSGILSLTLIGNIDSQIIAHYHSNKVIADFGFTSRLVLPFYLLISSINFALLPRLSASHRIEEVRYFVSRYIFLAAPVALVISVFALCGLPTLVNWVDPRYNDALTLGRLQLLSMTAFIFLSPLTVVLQSMGRAKIVASVYFLQLVLALSFDLLWIPHDGALGAVRATLAMNAIALLVVATLVAREAR